MKILFLDVQHSKYLLLKIVFYKNVIIIWYVNVGENIISFPAGNYFKRLLATISIFDQFHKPFLPQNIF